jgi:hypothetical protein
MSTSSADDGATPEAIHDQQELLQVLRRRLQHLLLLREQHDSKDLPFWIATEIDDTRAKIAMIKATLQGWQVQVTNHPNDTEQDHAQALIVTPHYIDPEIRKLRTAAYLELWRLLKSLARYDLPQPLTLVVLNELSIAMRNWYFDSGGLFLSENSRAPYFELKELIRQTVGQPREQVEIALSNDEIGQIIAIASRLRASLAQDLGTR